MANKMHPSSNYLSEHYSLKSSQMKRALSPRSSNLPSPRLADGQYSASSKFFGQVPNFKSQLLSQLTRIDPGFAFSPSTDPPLLQAISCITQAVELILNSQSSQVSFEGIPESMVSQKIKEEFVKCRETSKTLKKYEILLKKKEEKLEEEKQKIRDEKVSLRELEERLKISALGLETQEKKWNEARKYEAEKHRADKEDSERKLGEAKDLKERTEKKIEESSKHFKLEKESLLHLENCLNQTKAVLVADQKRISQEKLEIEKEKWKLEQRQRKLEEEEILFSVKREHLEEERAAIESEKINLQNLRKNIEDERNEIYLIKGQLTSYDRGSKMSKHIEENFNDDRQLDFEAKLLELEERENEIEQAYKELQEQMDNFNKELEEREILLDERELVVEKQEKEIKKKFENFQMIEASLIESKIQVEELRSFTIPELEKHSNYLESLLQELNDKKSEMEIALDSLMYQLEVAENNQGHLATIEEDVSDSAVGNTQINEMANDLEMKMQTVRDREEELESALVQLENDKGEVLRAAQIVKKAHDDIENKRAKFEKEIAEEREKIKSQVLKIENGTRLLNIKENELVALKCKLEEREKILALREKNSKIN